MLKPKRVILWFRQDLQLHDNESLQEALRYADEIIPLYVFDDRVFKGTLSFGFKKTGYHRAKFIIESVHDLRNNLRDKGAELYVRQGKPEDIIFNLVRELEVNYVYCNRERTKDEVAVQDALEKKLWSVGREVRYFRGKMLLYTADLPFPVTHCPDQFSSFRKEVEKIVPIRKPLEAPVSLGNVSDYTLSAGEIPNFRNYFPDKNGQLEGPVIGGESAALERLKNYSKRIKTKQNISPEGLFPDEGSVFSPYLSQGCLSPKLIYQEIASYAGPAAKKLFLHLLYRDYLRFIAKKYVDKIFTFQGIASTYKAAPNHDQKLLESWKKGKTGIPIIDAAMRQLNATGFISNKARQFCASFLIHDLKLNWQMGAEFFESKLIDYDPCSNWVNWNMLAGIGSDLKMERKLNLFFQAKKYDPRGKYVRYWIPSLQEVPDKFVHQPHLWNINSAEGLKNFGKNSYPAPILSD